MSKIFGDDFAKDPALKDFKDPAALVKAFKDTKAMVGKPRFDIPDASAPQEVQDAYKAALAKANGVPATAAEYGLVAPTENVPEGLGGYVEGRLEAFADQCRQLGINPTQAKGLQNFLDAMDIELYGQSVKAEAEAEAKSAETLTQHFDKLFPDQAQRDVAIQEVKAELAKALPPEIRNILQGKDSEELLVAAAALHKHFKTAYGQADNNAGDDALTGGKSIEELRKDATALMQTPEYKDPMNPGYAARKQEVDRLYQTIGAMQNAVDAKRRKA